MSKLDLPTIFPPPTTTTTTTTLIPKSHPNPSAWSSLIAKQKALRLHSLLTSPESFSSSYSRESAFTDAEWEARLQNPLAYSFVATKHADVDASALSDEAALLDGEWVGSTVLFGPTQTTDGEERNTLTFHISALFVLPAARRAGLATALIAAATLHAQHLAATLSSKTVVLKIAVERGNTHALRLYARSGFVNVGDAPVPGVGRDVLVLRRELTAQT